MGGDGQKASNVIKSNSGLTGLKNQASLANDPRITNIMSAYGSGKMSLAEAIQAGQKAAADAKATQPQAAPSPQGQPPAPGGGMIDENAHLAIPGYNPSPEVAPAPTDQTGDMYHALVNGMATDPLTGTKFATEQVQNNPLLSGMFGAGGMQDRMGAEEKDLSTRGYSLKPEDYEAYGQASDNIARMFGGQEQSISQALASRGLAAGGSGGAGTAYSGMMGNKFEQLASNQRQIAQQRMEMNRQRLNDVRGTLLKTNALGESAVQDQFGRNLTGTQNYSNTLKDAAHAGQIEQDQENKGFEQQQASQSPGLGEILMSLGGSATSSAASAFGVGAGTKVAGSVLGETPKKTS